MSAPLTRRRWRGREVDWLTKNAIACAVAGSQPSPRAARRRAACLALN
jgi:hypothetical protein